MLAPPPPLANVRTARPALLLLAWLAALLLGAPRAARAGDDATHANLLERAQVLLREAEIAYQAGDLKRAEAKAREALSQIDTADTVRPSDLLAPFFGVHGGVFAKDRQVTRLWLDRFAERNPYGERNPDLHYLRGFVSLWLEDDPDSALRSFERMVSLDPAVRANERDILTYAALRAAAGKRLDKMDYQGAVSLTQAAVRLAHRRGEDRKELAALGNLVIIYQTDRRYVEAEEVLAGLRTRDPENPFWHFLTGINIGSEKRWGDAIPPYERAIELAEAGKGSPTLATEVDMSYLRVANCYRNLAGGTADPAKRQAWLERARQRLASFIERQPQDSRGHY